MDDRASESSGEIVRNVVPLGAPPWPAADPFLFCVHHLDAYPAANAAFGPAASLEGRNLGSDFGAKDGWSMYHGEDVPGFPGHPHRGFETVTVVRRGLVDHSDSLGAAGRYGRGDVQWLTAGKGVVHAEMFPLLDAKADNPLELFQIWLNLPSTDKMADPHFTMLWGEDVPRREMRDAAGKASLVTVVAGRFGDAVPPPPPPRSWASRPESDVAIWTIRMEPGASLTLPAAAPGTNRVLYFYRGDALRVGEHAVKGKSALELRPDVEAPLTNGDAEAEILVLQGKPIGEPVAAYGPFVMNTRAEIEQAFADYRRTRFGGWPWPSEAPVHGTDPTRFARHADGRTERRT
jgi:redox-sensitive bicupin YhaK (pirin superfamily)